MTMHIYKNLLFLATAVVLMLGTAACDNEDAQRGKQLAEDLKQAWGNTAALQQVDKHYQQLVDSLKQSGRSPQVMNDAFKRSVGENDTMAMMAVVIAEEPKAFAEYWADHTVSGLLNGGKQCDEALTEFNLLNLSAQLLGKDEHLKLFKEATDKQVAGLDEKNQMVVYANATTPDKLGRSMLSERNTPGADVAACDRRAALLKDIYTPEQYKEFVNAYQTK